MAPPRRAVRQQLEVLINFIENNRDLIDRGALSGSALVAARKKWALLAHKLNSVPGGTMKSTESWKKYWCEWRHRCRKKAAQRQKFGAEAYVGRNPFLPLNDLEIRVLALGDKNESNTTIPTVSQTEDNGDFFDDGVMSDTEESVDVKNFTVTPKAEKSSWKSVVAEINSEPDSPVPSWVLDLESRKILTEERQANALESILALLKRQEERRKKVDERLADALTAMAGTLQDLNSGIHEAIQHMQQLHPIQTDWSSMKKDII